MDILLGQEMQKEHEIPIQVLLRLPHIHHPLSIREVGSQCLLLSELVDQVHYALIVEPHLHPSRDGEDCVNNNPGFVPQDDGGFQE